MILFLSLCQSPTQILFKIPTPLLSPPAFGFQLVPKSYHVHSHTFERIKKSRGQTTGSHARTEFWAIWRCLERGMAREGWGGVRYGVLDDFERERGFKRTNAGVGGASELSTDVVSIQRLSRYEHEYGDTYVDAVNCGKMHLFTHVKLQSP